MNYDLFCYNYFTRGNAVFAILGFDLYGIDEYARMEIEVREIDRNLIGILLGMGV